MLKSGALLFLFIQSAPVSAADDIPLEGDLTFPASPEPFGYAKASKMFSNLGNAMGAITDGQGDQQNFMNQVRREAELCFHAANVPFESPQAFETRSREQHRQSPLPPGVRNLGSSWQSLQRGLGSIEADFLNGEIVRLGRIHGVPTPYNEVLQEIANAMAAHHEKPGKYTAQDLEHLAERRAASPGGSPAPR